jgi:DNA-binding MurR/RpiR family transcriptional regulator
LVADYVLSDPDVVYRSITEAVKRSGAGYGSVVRFCKRLGYSGFQDLKIQLTKDMAVRTAAKENETGEEGSLARLREACLENIRHTAQLLSEDTLTAAAKALLGAESVLVVGFGASGVTAKEVEFRLTRFGIRAISEPDSQLQRTRAVSLASNDLLFMVSFSGSTKDIILIGELASKVGATTLCLTNFAESPVAELSDIRLLTSVRIDPLRAEVASRVAASFVLDAVFDRMARRDTSVQKVLEETFNITADTYL